MTLQEAIVARHSVRQYETKPIEDEKIKQLQAAIDDANADGRLHLQLITNEPEAFAKGMAKYGSFRGVSNYIALICKKGEDELIGYRGERIVLLAQTLGLNSCWVGLTFRKQPDRYTIADGEVMLGVIALGYGKTQGVQHVVRPMEKYYKSSVSPTPLWFIKGMEAAMLAPTAMHMQKFKFELKEGNKVSARTKHTLVGSYLRLDLGIVKCHFELAAGNDNFQWD